MPLENPLDLVFKNSYIVQIIFLMLQDEFKNESNVLSNFLLINKLFYKTQQETWRQLFYLEFPNKLPKLHLPLQENNYPLTKLCLDKININWRKQYSLIKSAHHLENKWEIVIHSPLQDKNEQLQRFSLVRHIYYGSWKELDENKSYYDTFLLTLDDLACNLPKPFNNTLFFQGLSIYLDYKQIKEEDFFCINFSTVIRIIEKSEVPINFFFTLLTKYGEDFLPKENEENDCGSIRSQYILFKALKIFSSNQLADFLNKIALDNWPNMLFQIFSKKKSYRDKVIAFLSNFADYHAIQTIELAKNNKTIQSQALQDIYSSKKLTYLIEDYQLNLLGRGSFKIDNLFIDDDAILTHIKELIDEYGIEKIIQSRDPFKSKEECNHFLTLLETVKNADPDDILIKTVKKLKSYFNIDFNNAKKQRYFDSSSKNKKRFFSEIDSDGSSDDNSEQSQNDDEPPFKKHKLNDDGSESDSENQGSMNPIQLGL